MSKPRPVFSNRILLITRRCVARTFLFGENTEATNIFKYFLALAAARFDVEIHAFVLMSNHYHIVLTDRHGCHPAFTCWLNGMVARFVNSMSGREDALWDGRQVNVVDLLDPDAVARKISYVLTNPIRAGLRADPTHVSSYLKNDRDTSEFATIRPDVLASTRTDWPLIAELLLRPPAEGPISGQPLDLEALVTQYVDATLKALQRPKEPSGAARAPAATAAKTIPSGERPAARPYRPARRPGLTPRVASADPAARLDYMSMIRRFERLHRNARLAAEDQPDIANYPPGTYRGRVRHGRAPTLSCVGVKATAVDPAESSMAETGGRPRGTDDQTSPHPQQATGEPGLSAREKQQPTGEGETSETPDDNGD